MSWTVIYDGNTLDNSIGCAIDKIKDSPMVKLKESPLLSDGSAIEQYTKGGRRISMSGTIIGTSTSNLDTRVSNVIESFNFLI